MVTGSASEKWNFNWFRIDNKHMTEPWLNQVLMDSAYRSDIATFWICMDATFLVWVVYINFLLKDTTDRSKISSDQKGLFFAVSLYPPLIHSCHVIQTEITWPVYCTAIGWSSGDVKKTIRTICNNIINYIYKNAK